MLNSLRKLLPYADLSGRPAGFPQALLFSSGSPEDLQSQVQMNNKKIIMTLPIIINFTEGFLCAGHSQIYSVTSQMSLIK